VIEAEDSDAQRASRRANVVFHCVSGCVRMERRLTQACAQARQEMLKQLPPLPSTEREGEKERFIRAKVKGPKK